MAAHSNKMPKTDPEMLKGRLETWHHFIVFSKYATIVTVVVLALMALFLV